MPNLKDWIEAQLKRGYSRKQIKSALIRKGYSPKAVAEVDRIALISQSRKKTANNKKSLNSKVLVIAVILIAASIVYFASKSDDGVSEESRENIEAKYAGISEPKIGCEAFSSNPDEISCQDAIKLALEEYPGKHNSVNKTQITFQNRVLPGQVIQQDVWLIGIDLKEPIQSSEREYKKIEVAIGIYDKTLRLYKLISEE